MKNQFASVKKQIITACYGLSVIYILLLLAIFSVIAGCKREDVISGSGNPATEHRNLTAFTDVEKSGSFRVHLISDTVSGVEINAEDNIISKIETVIIGSTLYIRIKNGVSVHDHLPIHVYVHSHIFQRVSSMGSGSVDNKDTLHSLLFTYQVEGSNDGALLLSVKDLKISINGSGNVTMRGQANTLNSEINGQGTVIGLGLATQNADITIRGAGEHSISVSNELHVGIYGSGKVTYTGNPGKIEKEILGNGTLIKQ